MRFRAAFPVVLFAFLRLLPECIAAEDRFNILDDALLDDKIWIHYSSRIYEVLDKSKNKLNIDDPTVFSDEYLVGAAFEAWQEMADLHAYRHPDDPGSRPAVMAALQIKDELYFSSSIKNNGGGFMLSFPDSCATIALERCSATSENGDPHRTGGNCGEVGAVNLFCLAHPEVPPGPLPQPARMVAVWYNTYKEQMDIKNPCEKSPGDPYTWGCTTFLRNLNVRAITKGTAATLVPQDWRIYWEAVCL
jgi:hypothetical protein